MDDVLMPEQVKKQRPTVSEREARELREKAAQEQADVDAALEETDKSLKDETDELMDEIDGLLEENEVLVNFRQKGGE